MDSDGCLQFRWTKSWVFGFIHDEVPREKGSVRYCWKGKVGEKDMAYKQYKDTDKNRVKQMQKECQTQAVAGLVVSKFTSATAAKKVLVDKITVLSVSVLSFVEDEKVLSSYFVEPWISTRFKKWRSNMDFQNHYLIKNKMDEVANTLSHFSLIFTNQRMLLCDIQGSMSTIKDQMHEFEHVVLTDLAFHTEEPGFEDPTNHKRDGIRKFMEHHQCTRICAALEFAPLKKK
jgi:hypothetical protein